MLGRDSKGRFLKAKSKFVNSICLICGLEFYTRPCFKTTGKGKYCSSKCYGISKKGKPTWNKGMATFDKKKYQKKYQEEHRELMRLGVRKYMRRNREKWYAYKQNWRKENPEREKLYQEKRKAMKLNAEINDFTIKEWIELIVEYKHSCAYCGRYTEKLTQDHIIPLNRGGNHTKLNIVPACSSCNCRKNDLLLSEDIKSNFQLFKIYLNKEVVLC
jgi:5-methylcytosine-specific restriction endonuclease McrA